VTAPPDSAFAALDLERLPSPCYVIDLVRLEVNLKLLKTLANAADVKILLALKAFSCFALADLIGQYLHGTAASGLWEARLGRTRFKGEVHSYAPGLKADHLAAIETLSDHLIFNSLNQWHRFEVDLAPAGGCSYGLRVNPRHSEAETPLYDPCAPWSRLGVTAEALGDDLPGAVNGLHVHALCDQGFDPFDRLLTATEQRFGHLFGSIEWINLGGGQLITASDYPLDRLIGRLSNLRRRTGLSVYLEPGTAVALDAGALVTEVLDTGRNDGSFAVLDCSATCHMPDVIEAPYTPDLLGAEQALDPDPQDSANYRLGGPTCLAGDVIGTYRFDRPPRTGDRLCFLDQAYYTMVKASTFNGTPLPAIALWHRNRDTVEVIRRFCYEDFEGRLS
jgi:carboxynorspermidine decarboxylase